MIIMLSSKVGGFAAFAIGSTTAAVGLLAPRLEIKLNFRKCLTSGLDGKVSKHGNGRDNQKVSNQNMAMGVMQRW